MNGMMDRPSSVEPHGSAVVRVRRVFSYPDYQIIRDVAVPAMSKEEARAWINARAPHMRGSHREAMFYFLTRQWELRSGWYIGARFVDFYHVVVVFGNVDALRRFVQKTDATVRFSYKSARRVLELIVERINQASTQSA